LVGDPSVARRQAFEVSVRAISPMMSGALRHRTWSTISTPRFDNIGDAIRIYRLKVGA